MGIKEKGISAARPATNISTFFKTLAGYMKKSLVRKLMFFYCVIVMIPVLLLDVYILKQAESYLQEKTINMSENFADTSAKNITVKINECENALSMINTDKVINNLLEPDYYSNVEIVDVLNNYSNDFPRQVSKLNSSIIGIHVFMMENQLPDLTRFFYYKDRVEKEPWFARALRQLSHEDILWITTIENKPVYPGEPVYNGTVTSGLIKLWSKNFKTVTGIAEIRVNQDELFGLLTNWSGEKSVPEVLVLDEFNGIAYSTLKDGYDWLRVTHELTPQDTIKNFYESHDRNNYYATYRYVNRLRSSIYFFFPMADVKNQTNVYRNLSIILGLIFISLLAVVYYFVAKKVFKGFKELVGAVDRIKNGNLNTHIEISGTDDVWELARNINVMTCKIKELIETNIKSQVAHKDAQLMALQAQINPHYLYNTLEVIRMMAEAEDKFVISDTINSLGSTMRYGISTKSTQVISLKDEIKYIHHYIRIQKLHLKDGVEFNLSVSLEVLQEAGRCRIMKFLIQPVIENAIIHGVRDSHTKGIVNITIEDSDDVLRIKIANNGNTIPPGKLDNLKKALKYQEGYSLPDSKSIGIRNVNERIKLYYGSQYGMDIESSEGLGTVVVLRIPYVLLDD